MDKSEILSVPEVARLIGKTERTIHNMINRQELLAYEEWQGNQRRRYIPRALVEAWLEKHPRASGA